MKNENLFTKDIKKDTRSFAEILNIVPELYHDVILTDEVVISPHIVSVLNSSSLYTLCDLLYCSPFELMDIRHIGDFSFELIVNNMIKYCRENKGDEHYHQPEQIHIDNIAGKMYKAAECRKIIRELTEALPDYISSKPALPFAQIYSVISPYNCGYLFNLPDKILINQIQYTLSDIIISDVRVVVPVFNLFKWLQLDIIKTADLTFSYATLTERELSILRKRANNLTRQELSMEYKVIRSTIRSIERRAMFKIKRCCTKTNYNPLMLIYAMQSGRRSITKYDFEEYIGTERAQILWFIIQNHIFDCYLYAYSDDKDTLDFYDISPKNNFRNFYRMS